MKRKTFSILTIIGLILGFIIGLYFKDVANSIEVIGTYYVKILKIFITPILFTSISYTIYETSKKKNGLILKSIILFIIMFITTFLLTSLLVVLIDPAEGFEFESVTWNGSTTKFSIVSMLINLLPKSLSDIFVNPKVFAIIMIAYIVGKIGSFIKTSDKFFKAINTIKIYLYKALEIFMYITPLAVMALVSTTVSKYGTILLGVGVKYIGVAWACSVVTLIVVMILPASIIGKVSVKEYIKKVKSIWLMTLTTCSSAATLPYTVKLCKEELNIKDEITDVVVPLGCTIHMCGGAVSFALLGLFCASLYGVEISFGTYVLMIISSLLINMAAPGIPNGGIVIGASFLEMLGIPLGFIGFYSGIYKFLDMAYTSLNVTGDITANIILNKISK